MVAFLSLFCVVICAGRWFGDCLWFLALWFGLSRGWFGCLCGLLGFAWCWLVSGLLDVWDCYCGITFIGCDLGARWLGLLWYVVTGLLCGFGWFDVVVWRLQHD